MRLFTKWLDVPETNNTRQIEAIQLWEVRWVSRHGEYSHSMSPEMEAFASQEEAESFAASLRNAFKLIRHTSGNRVIVKGRELGA
jgi:hypothetical protein